MNLEKLFISGLHTDKLNNASPVAHFPTKSGYIAGDFLDQLFIWSREQNRPPDSASTSKKPQATIWLFAAFLSFDNIPHNSLSNFRELWGMLSNLCACFYPWGRRTSASNKKAHLIPILCHYSCDFTSAFSHWYKYAEKSSLSSIMSKTACAYVRPSFLFRMIRGPPLLKF